MAANLEDVYIAAIAFLKALTRLATLAADQLEEDRRDLRGAKPVGRKQ